MSLVDDLIPHMRRVQSAERDLRDLSLLWQMIEASSAISCPDEAESILPMLAQTRARFSALQTRLVNQLGTESLAELRDELGSTAQCTIDILVRNLFERTADVGFLATDGALRGFCAASAEQRDAQRAGLLQRLAEYRAKYSVYDDIILVAPDGRLLARLDDSGAAASSSDPIIATALSRHGYVESFGSSDLAAGTAPALLYGHRIDDTGGRCVGVLVLRFRKADEMTRIFGSMADDRRQMALLLLDANDCVIASNDETHVPVGARVQTAAAGELALTAFGGREYLSVTRPATGYQGYAGPGWRVQGMVSLLTAFRSRHDLVDDSAHLALDNDELAMIRAEVDAINADLRRVVWNGRLVAGTHGGAQARLKAVLKQINEAGTRTRDRVAAAILDLYRSSLGRAQHQASDLATLAADIMDRNLYERANDCRWWALSPVLERVLAQPASDEGSSELNAVLSHVNSLYTVYTRLVAFDADGVVRGVSNDDPEQPLLGTVIDADLLQAAAALPDSQRYAVSAFTGSPLSGGVPTYVYLASVRGAGRSVGGIAIVFNAEREFRAMLDDVLGGRAGLATFVDGAGIVVASTDVSLVIGAPLPFDAGKAVADHAGVTYATAEVAAGGYREFKRSDGYQNHVRAVVALRLGSQERRRHALHDSPVQALLPAARSESRPFALFHIGAGRFALPAGCVLEARPKEGLVRAPIGLPHAAGLLEVPGPNGTVIIPVLCGRSLFGIHYAPRPTDGVVLVITLPEAPGVPLMGLRVDDVLSVADVGSEHQQPAPPGLRQHSPLLCGLLRLAIVNPPVQAGGQPNDGEVLAQLLDERRLVLSFGVNVPATAAAPDIAVDREAQAA
jgi:chemotaxis signal transduction protein